MGRRARTPTLLQLEAAECGAVALGMILSYHGRFVPAAELREQCGVSRDGSRASKIVQAARSHGLEAAGLLRSLNQLDELPTPYVVFWNFNHFLVVEEVGRDYVRVNDPAFGHHTLTREEFSSGYSGVVLTFKPGESFRKGGRPVRLLPLMIQRLRAHATVILVMILTGMLLILPALAIPGLMAVFVDQVLLEQRREWVRPIGWLLFATTLFQILVLGVQTAVIRRLRAVLGASLASQFFWHLLHLPMTFYLQRFPGEISSRQALTIKVADVLSVRLARAIGALITLLILTGILFIVEPLLAAVAAALVLVTLGMLLRTDRQLRETSIRAGRDAGRVAGIGLAGIEGIETIKAGGMESGFFEKWVSQYLNVASSHQEMERVSLSIGVLPRFMETLLAAALLILGGYLVVQGQLTIGLLVAFQALAVRLFEPVGELVRLASAKRELQADLSRIEDVFTHPVLARTTVQPPTQHEMHVSDPDSDIILLQSEPRLHGHLEARGLTFGYSPLDPPLFDNFDLTVQPGEWVALVGTSGSGKSTLIRLLAGLYGARSGEVFLDGQSRDSVPPRLHADSVGYVDQDITLFPGTVRDNLTLWEEQIPDDRLWQTCEDAAIASDVRSWPGSLDAIIREGGANLSVGQRQRLEIARVLVTAPRLLLLDEPTSALDSETEAAVLTNLRRRGVSCILAAHRLSTVRDCDRVLVLDQGRVVQSGSPRILARQDGPFARLLEAEAP